MLNGIAPILIFNFKKLTPSAAETIGKIPVVSSIVNAIGLPPIPLYLDPRLTGIEIDQEGKNIDVETEMQTKPDGTDPTPIQKGINNTVTVNMVAEKDSIGLTILTALTDVIFPKVTS